MNLDDFALCNSKKICENRVMLKALNPQQEKRILIVDDDPGIIEIIEFALEGQDYEIKTSTSAMEALDLIENWHPQLMIIDVNLPQLSGMEAVRRLRDQRENFSVIMISGSTDTEQVIAGLEAGADDYITKPFNSKELLARVRAQFRIRDLTDQLVRTNARLKELVDTDDLTGLLNMRSLYSRLNYEIERGKRYQRTVCVVMMDLDEFKSVNDGHDHLFGSFVLTEVGKIIRNSIRNVDIAARYGGDEFLIVLTEIDRQAVYSFCERLRNRVSQYHFQNGFDEMRLTMSLGFAITDPNNPDIDAKQLVRVADWALYEAKRQGRNRVCYFDLSEHPEFMQLTYKKAQ